MQSIVVHTFPCFLPCGMGIIPQSRQKSNCGGKIATKKAGIRKKVAFGRMPVYNELAGKLEIAGGVAQCELV